MSRGCRESKKTAILNGLTIQLLTSCAFLGKLLDLSEAQSPHLYNGDNRARTRVPCIGRRIPHCATREARIIIRRVAHSLQLEKAQAQQQRPNAAKNKYINKFIKKKTANFQWSSRVSFYLLLLFFYFIFGCVGSSLQCAGFSLIAASGAYS